MFPAKARAKTLARPLMGRRDGERSRGGRCLSPRLGLGEAAAGARGGMGEQAPAKGRVSIDAANTIDVPSGAPLGAENGKGPAAETADGAQTPSPAALPAATERGGPPSIEDRRRESLLSRAKSLLYAAEIPLVRFAAQKRKSPAPEGADAGLTSALKTGVSGLRRSWSQREPDAPCPVRRPSSHA